MIGYRIHKPAREPDSKKKKDEIEVPDPLNKEDLICYNEIVNEDKQMNLIKQLGIFFPVFLCNILKKEGLAFRNIGKYIPNR